MSNDDAVTETVVGYRKSAIGTSNPSPEAANESARRLHEYYKQLQASDAGRKAIENLIVDANPHVRCWAAAHILEWNPDAAKRVLEELADGDEPCSFDAQMILAEFRKGRLSFDY
ncbi:MAG: hypothetical protein ACC700_13110 [Anaerolineales bacterium]